MDEFASPSFSSIEPDVEPSFSPRGSQSATNPAEHHKMFEEMCRSYETLRLQALDMDVSESEFVSRLGLSAPCFLENPELFAEVHRMWCIDYERALMHRVDPFKTTLELLRSHLDPAIPSELCRRKELQRVILGSLKSPQVVLGASPFDLPRTSFWRRREKTSLKKLQAAYEASRLANAAAPLGGDSLSLPRGLLPSSSQRKLEHTRHKRATVIVDVKPIASTTCSSNLACSTVTASACDSSTSLKSNSSSNTAFTLADLLSTSRACRESPRNLGRWFGLWGRAK